ncbi:hypothetical protein MUDAN_DOGOELCO_02529 [Lactiplantibacillus mudanjiangensis]|nr:hypothetical protein MUDAN_DOGOELCO_02529 [Lactiplantibacillus mudanjiangensis]
MDLALCVLMGISALGNIVLLIIKVKSYRK